MAYAPAGLDPVEIVRLGAVPDASTDVRQVPPSFSPAHYMRAVAASAHIDVQGVMAFSAQSEVAFVAHD